MKIIDLDQPTIEQNYDAFDKAQQRLNGAVDLRTGQVSAVTAGDGLDVLTSHGPDGAGFYDVKMPVGLIAKTPQLLGRILLMGRPNGLMMPTVIMPDRQDAAFIRVAMLRQPFVPRVGLTPGITFGLALESTTQSPGFGGHDKPALATASAPLTFEGGHFGVSLTGVVSAQRASSLQAYGDAAADNVLHSGLPADFKALGLAPGMPIPEVKTVDTISMAGAVLPLAWHPELQNDSGAALAQYPDTEKLLLGAAMRVVGPSGLDRAAELAVAATRRS